MYESTELERLHLACGEVVVVQCDDEPKLLVTRRNEPLANCMKSHDVLDEAIHAGMWFLPKWAQATNEIRAAVRLQLGEVAFSS